jgi:flagella basal body P-ring formation protein FlgA
VGPLAAPGSPKAELVREVAVKSERITLSDFLPGSASSTLRADCSQIDLGHAPQPGTVRALTRDEIEALLSPELESELAIPARMVVRRTARVISREELAKAIREALDRPGLARLSGFNLDAIDLAAPVYVTVEDAGLEVTRLEYDVLRHQARFRLWTSKEPQILPFYVSVDYRAKLPALVAKHEISVGRQATSDDFQLQTRAVAAEVAQPPLAPGDLEGLEARVSVKAGQVVTRSMFKPVVLVEPGVPARLEVEGNGFRVETTVIPLQQGLLGQKIRARDEDTHKVFLAEVVGPELLRTKF